ncbi:MAG: 50S ribosomal protein L11 [Thermodesulfobacteriota bacterium]|nr:50S ribosomal protein L11 [Thermodesulfobacteriota bacterium]MEE2974931.1 50S ribosomal protein L11 [Thermodesulfobacteriota bacterium]|tara:strand:- start:3394 stop:3816 length:423 start_codon:yes stop_codon:yes gene_type:complete
MAKKVAGSLKLLCEAGKASPAPPIGPALGQKGVNIMEFCKAFNSQSEKMEGVLPVVVTVYEDRTFSFEIKTPPVSYLIKKAANIKKGSNATPAVKAGQISDVQVEEIAKTKMKDLNANDIDAAKKIVQGTARSMGVEVEG